MKRKNLTRNALFTSIISLLLCVSMLVGTTFAWFTDSVVSGTNVIAAGNLDVELYHGKDQNPIDQVKEDTLLFTDVGGNVIDQWEPGVVAFTNLKVANVGTLALKYQLSVNSTETNYVQYPDGTTYTLADALKVAVVKGGVSGTREAVVAKGDEAGWEGLKSFILSGELEGDEKSETYGIVIYWQPGDNETDNLFNMNNDKTTSDGKPLSITLGVNLFATQEMYEDDSFGPDYDESVWDDAMQVLNAQELQAAIDAGETAIMLMADIAVDEQILIPEGKTVALNLNGKKLSSAAGTVIRNEGTLELAGSGTVESTAQAYAIRVQKGNVTVDSADINVKGAFGAVSVFNGANVTINGGNYKADGIAGMTSHTIYMGGYGTLNINGGSFYRAAGGDSGGVIVGYGWENEANEKAVININGGTINSEAAWGWISNYDGAWTTITVTGGTFGRDPGNYVAEGYKATQIGEVYYVTTEGMDVAGDTDSLNNALDESGNVAEGGEVVLTDDLTVSADETNSESAYGATGVSVKGGEFDGNGNTLTVNDANGTWDCAVYTTGGTIKNLTIGGSFRGILVPSLESNLYVDNVTIDDVCYTFHTDGTEGQINDYVVEISNSTLNGWTSYSNNVKHVTFTNCEFGKGTGGYQYAYMRPYAATTLVGCTFEEGFEFDTSKTSAITFENCYYGDTLITTANAATLGSGDTTFFYNGLNGITINDAQVVESAEDLVDALENGGNVVLTESLSDAPVTTTAPYGNYYGVAQNGGVLDGNGKTLDFDLGELKNGKADNYGIMTSGGTIKNVTITGVFRGIMIMKPTEDVYIDNVTIGDEDVCYAINTGEGDGTKSVIVTNSTIKGWSSYGNAVKSVSFTNCTFAQGEYYDDVFGRLVKPYVDTVFENCEFNSKFYIDLSALTTDGDGNVVNPDAKVVLRNCTVNGVKLTAENWKDLIVAESDCGEGQISIEAINGTGYMTADNILDYVVIE